MVAGAAPGVVRAVGADADAVVVVVVGVAVPPLNPADISSGLLL